MVANVLDSVPSHIKAPDNVELKISTVDTNLAGVFCIWPIAEGTQFGPYVGKIVPAAAAKGIDRRYSWEVFNLETLTLIHVLDATDPKDGNWMRYVNCARFFEEQNIVSVQLGQDVYYKAIKNIEPGEELLTWFKPKRGRKRKSTTDQQEVKVKQEPVSDVDTLTPKKMKQDMPDRTPEKTKRIRKPKIIPDAYEGPLLVPKKYKPVDDDEFEPLKPGQLRRRRKKKSVDSVSNKDSSDKVEDSLITMEKECKEKNSSQPENNRTASPNGNTKVSSLLENDESSVPLAEGKKKRGRKKLNIKTETEDCAFKKEKEEKSPKKDRSSPQMPSATSQLVEINNSVDWEYPQKGQEYIFKLEKHMITHGPNGCVYTCDICHGIYKNKFSLKRHYLRNHINYKYLSKADIINCLINLQQVLEAEGDYARRTSRRKRRRNVEVNEAKSDSHNDCSNEGLVQNITAADSADDKTETKTESNDLGELENENGSCVDETGYCLQKNRVPFSKSTDDMESGRNDINISDEGTEELQKIGQIKNDLIHPGSNDNKGKTDHIRNDDICMDDGTYKENENSEIVSNTYSDEDMENANSFVSKQNKAEKGDSHFIDQNKIREMTQKEGQIISKKEFDTVKMEYGGIYRCYTCREIFDTLAEIRDHTMGHSEKDSVNMPYQCDRCSMRFFFKQNLVRHSASHEGKSVIVKKDPASSDSMVHHDNIHRNHRCATCQQRFENLDKLSKHQVKHKNDLAKKKFPCQYCGKDFLSLPNMKKHVRFHLGYRITCRYCTEVFSNVGALRKHTRISHPEIYKAKQLDKIARHGVLRRPDKKSLDTKEEEKNNVEVKIESKDKKTLKRKSSKEKLPESHDGVKVEIKGEPKELKEEDFHFDHDISFAADEIDDGGSRFKFSCTVCKKRFSNYINMCRHRRKVHSNESKPKVDGPLLNSNPKKQPPVVQTPEEIALFYASVSHNIATNLNEYIDGKPESLEHFRDHLKVDDYVPISFQTEKDEKPLDLTWEMYNFPPNFKPGKTISFSEIRKEFDIHSDFDDHCKSFLSDSESQTGTVKSFPILKKGEVEIPREDKYSEKTVENSGSKGSVNLESRRKESKPALVETKQADPANTENSNINSTKEPELLAIHKDSCNSDMDLTATKVRTLVKKQIGNTQVTCPSPCSSGFKHIEKGEYANFDDLLLGDFESPLISRSQSVSSSVPSVKWSTDHKSSTCTSLKLEREALSSEVARPDSPSSNPKPLSLLCENLLGLKRKEPTTDSSMSLNNSFTSLDSIFKVQSGHNSSILSTLSLAASRKEDERFQSTNEIFRDIKADYSEAPNHNLDNYQSIAFGKNGQVACVCAICKKHFRDFESLIRHHWKKHPASVCHFIEVEQGHEIDSLHFSEPSTVGALAVTDPGLENVLDREVFTCTRCGTSFKTLARLHIHIVNCAAVDPIQGVTKEENGSKTPVKKKIQKKLKNILNGGNSFKFKIQDFAGFTAASEKDTEEIQSQSRVFTGCRKRTSTILPDSSVKLTYKKSHDSIGYNPQNHVRRRELTELVDSHQCEACGIKFRTIILLERHVPNCSKKEKFKDLCPMKCPIIDESLEKLKHVCHYCKKHFTYLKSLVNHLQDFCAVKKLKVDENVVTEEDKMKENEIIQKFKKLEEEKSMKDDLKIIDVGKKKGWQKGLKRKPKKKGHSWTVIKKRKPSVGIDVNLKDTHCINNDNDDMAIKSTKEISDSKDISDDESDSDTCTSKELSSDKEESSKGADSGESFTQVNITSKDGTDKLYKKVKETDLSADKTEGNERNTQFLDSIDEVDSAVEVTVNHKKNSAYLHGNIHSQKEFIITSDIVVEALNETERSELSKASCLEANKSSDETFLQKGNNDFGPPHVQGTVEYKTVTGKSRELHYIDQLAKELNSKYVEKPKSTPTEVNITTSSENGKSKSLFQCLGSKGKVNENGIENDSSKNKKLGIVEKKKESIWQKYRRSFKKKLVRSKGKYLINRNTTNQSADKCKETAIYKSIESKEEKDSHDIILWSKEANDFVEMGNCIQKQSQINGGEPNEKPVKEDKQPPANADMTDCDSEDKKQPAYAADNEFQKFKLATYNLDKSFFIKHDNLEINDRKKTQSSSNTETEILNMYDNCSEVNTTIDTCLVSRLHMPEKDVKINEVSEFHAAETCIDKLEVNTSSQDFQGGLQMRTNDKSTSREEILQKEDSLKGNLSVSLQETHASLTEHMDEILDQVDITNSDSSIILEQNDCAIQARNYTFENTGMAEIKPDVTGSVAGEVKKLSTDVWSIMENDSDEKAANKCSSDISVVTKECKKVTESKESRSVDSEIVKISQSENKKELVCDKLSSTDANENVTHFDKSKHVNDICSDSQVISKTKSDKFSSYLKDDSTEIAGTSVSDEEVSVSKTKVTDETEAVELDQVYESVSEKVKKRKRNASALYVSESAFRVKKKMELKRKPGDKNKLEKNGSCSKRETTDMSSTAKDLDMSSQKKLKSTQGNLIKELQRDKRLKNQHSSSSDIVRNTKIKHVTPKKKSKHILTKLVNTPDNSGVIQTADQKQDLQSDDLSRTDKPYEIVLSPSERVKMNKRQCKKKTYNFGLTNIEQEFQKSTNIHKKNSGNENVTESFREKNLGTKQEASERKRDTDYSFVRTENTRVSLHSEAAAILDGEYSHYRHEAENTKEEKKFGDVKKLPKKVPKTSLKLKAAKDDPKHSKDKCIDTKQKRGRPKKKENAGN